MQVMNILGNIIAPFVSGLIFFIFALFFLTTSSQKSTAAKFFSIYLLSFSIFVSMRPVQLLIGPYPLPIYVNSIRSILMLAIAIPSLSVANLSFTSYLKPKWIGMMFFVGALLSIIYVIFGTNAKEAYVAFTIGGIPAYEPLLPNMLSPWYPREVTILTYMLGGLQAALSGSILLFNQRREVEKEFLMFGLGSTILGLSIIFGVLVKIWLVYYVAPSFPPC